MASVLRDGELLRNCEGKMVAKWQLKYPLSEQRVGRYCIDDRIAPFVLFHYLNLKANGVRVKSVFPEGVQMGSMVGEELNILEVFIVNKAREPWNSIGPADGYIETELNGPGLTWIEEVLWEDITRGAA